MTENVNPITLVRANLISLGYSDEQARNVIGAIYAGDPDSLVEDALRWFDWVGNMKRADCLCDLAAQGVIHVRFDQDKKCLVSLSHGESPDQEKETGISFSDLDNHDLDYFAQQWRTIEQLRAESAEKSQLLERMTELVDDMRKDLKARSDNTMLRSAHKALDALLADKPMLAAFNYGNNSLGNLRAEIGAVL